MLVSPTLTHRADVYRRVQVDNDGSPLFTWQRVQEAVPCLFSVPGIDSNPEWDQATQERASLMAQVVVLPRADLKPNDRLNFTRPDGLGKAVVTHVGAAVAGPDGVSHQVAHVVWENP